MIYLCKDLFLSTHTYIAMNQTFNLKRFLRYTRFILSMNRWYYGIVRPIKTKTLNFENGF